MPSERMRSAHLRRVLHLARCSRHSLRLDRLHRPGDGTSGEQGAIHPVPNAWSSYGLFALEPLWCVGVLLLLTEGLNADGCAMDDAGAADRGLQAQGKDPAPRSAAHDLSDPLAASERSQVALCSR